MKSSEGLSIAVVGLGFGQEFLPIYRSHPDVGRIGICDADKGRLNEVGDRHGIEDRFHSLEEVLADDRYDAVHLLTPVAHHARQVLQVLRSGRHCACAVPMATSLEDLQEIIDAQRTAKTTYMMMETAVYGREYLYARRLRDTGVLGPLTFLRGYHLQDLEGFPTYWWGFPPMYYITHALSPLLALAESRAATVRCLGSGRIPQNMMRDYDNAFGLETAQFRLAGRSGSEGGGRKDLAAEVTMAFHQTGRSYQEGFSVYGYNGGFEWEQIAGEGAAQFTALERSEGRRGRPFEQRRVKLPDFAEVLPREIRQFTLPSRYDPGTGRPFDVPAHHGGSHPHLVHEFVSSVLEGRPAAVDALTAARWTAPGICAHESAMREGKAVTIPAFDEAY